MWLLILPIPMCVLITALAGCSSASLIAITLNPPQATVSVDGKLFTRYHGGTTTPYFYPVLTADQRAVTRGYPVDPQPDEEFVDPHHRSLWIGHADINGVDFWNESGGSVEQTSMRALGDELIVNNTWRDGTGHTQCVETRCIRFIGGRNSRQINIRCRFVSQDGPLRLGSTRDAFLALRMAPPLRLDGNIVFGRLHTSRGARDLDVRDSRGRWLACEGLLEGAPVTIVIFDHPENPNYPTAWEARVDGLLAANPFAPSPDDQAPSDGGVVLALDGVPLDFVYGILIVDGAVEADWLDRTWQDWVTDSGIRRE